MTVGGPEAVLVAFVLLSAAVTLLLRDVLAAIIAFAAFSLGMAVLYLLLRAPDVALTEAAIGAGVTTVLFLLAITKTVRPTEGYVIKRIHWPGVAVAVAFAAVLLATVPAIPAVGDPAAPAYSYEGVTGYYLANAADETGVENAVTAVLAAYRGFDTLGEAVVVFTAGVAILIVLREERFT